MRKGLEGPGVPWWTQIRGWAWGLGPGNTNVAGWVPGGWVPGIAPSQHPTTAPPRVLPLPTAPLYRMSGTWVLTCRTCSLAGPKEILGVDNAPSVHGYIRGHAGAVSALPPPYAPALRPAPWRLGGTKPQYISVYLSYISELV